MRIMALGKAEEMMRNANIQADDLDKIQAKADAMQDLHIEREEQQRSKEVEAYAAKLRLEKAEETRANQILRAQEAYEGLILKMQESIKLTQEAIRELEEGELPARRQIVQSTERAIDANLKLYRQAALSAEQGKINATQLAAAWKLYEEQLTLIGEKEKLLFAEEDSHEKAATKKATDAINRQGLKDYEKQIKALLDVQEEIGAYMTKAQLAANRDEANAVKREGRTVNYISMIRAEEIAVIAAEAAKVQALAPFDALQQKRLKLAEDARIASAYRRESEEIKAAIQKDVDSVDRLEKAFEHINTPLAANIKHFADSVRTIREHDAAIQKIIKRWRDEAASERVAAAASAARAAAERGTAQGDRDAAAASTALTNARLLEAAATKAAARAAEEKKLAEAEAAGAAIANIAGVIAGRKAQAYVEMVFDTGMGIYETAKALTPGNPFAAQDALAAVEYFAAAAEQGKIALSSGAGGGGGAGASGGIAGGSSGPQSAGATGSQTPMQPAFTKMGGPPPPGTLHVMVVGPNAAAQWMANHLNNLTQQQGGQLIASRAIQPTKAGR